MKSTGREARRCRRRAEQRLTRAEMVASSVMPSANNGSCPLVQTAHDVTLRAHAQTLSWAARGKWQSRAQRVQAHQSAPVPQLTKSYLCTHSRPSETKRRAGGCRQDVQWRPSSCADLEHSFRLTDRCCQQAGTAALPQSTVESQALTGPGHVRS